MVQFLSRIFFFGFLQFLLGFSKVPFFCVTLYIYIYIYIYIYFFFFLEHPTMDSVHDASFLTDKRKQTFKFRPLNIFRKMYVILFSFVCKITCLMNAVHCLVF